MIQANKKDIIEKMFKKHLWLFVSLALFILGSSAIVYFWPTKIQPKQEFKIQGLTWRTYSYYYHPLIYNQGYNFWANRRFLTKAKKTGANFLLVRAFYSGTPEGELIGDTAKAQKSLKKAIAQAHKAGFGIFLTPYVESREYWTNKKWHLSFDVWTKNVLNWAQFAQENNVEIFAPGVEMNLIFNENEKAAAT